MRKGEITSTMLVTVILLVLGFVILLFLYYQVSWTGLVDREVCHQSVINRATVPSIGGAKEFIPLKCKTEKICITSGLFGGACEEEFGKEKGVTKIKVSSGEKGETQVEKAIAQGVIDCWSTMGEGKVSLFSQYWAETYGVGSVYPSCVICSRIAFDEDKLENKIDLSKIDVIDYMMKHFVPNKDVTYYGYLSDSPMKISDKVSISDLKGVMKDEDGEFTGYEYHNAEQVEIEDAKISDSADELAIVFMQISSPRKLDVLKNAAIALGITAGSSYFLAPKTTTLALKAGVKSPYFWAVLAIAGIYQQGNVWRNQAVTAGYCGDVSVGEARSGCSVVRVVKYSEEDIAKYCSVIESIR